MPNHDALRDPQKLRGMITSKVPMQFKEGVALLSEIAGSAKLCDIPGMMEMIRTVMGPIMKRGENGQLTANLLDEANALLKARFRAVLNGLHPTKRVEIERAMQHALQREAAKKLKQNS